MYETLITNIVNNIFHIVWFNNLVLEPKYDKKKDAVHHNPYRHRLSVRCLGCYPAQTSQNGLFSRCVYCDCHCIWQRIFVCAVCFEPQKGCVSTLRLLLSVDIYLRAYIADNPKRGRRGRLWRLGTALWPESPFPVSVPPFFKKKLLYIYRQMKIGYGMITCISGLTFVMMTFCCVTMNII